MKEGKVGAKIRLVEVIPITKSLGEPLTYFAIGSLKVGQVVRVPLRKKRVPAVVVSVRNAREAKSGLRTASYSLKKISKRDALDAFLPQAVIALAETLATYYATSTGAILANILPKFIEDDPTLLGNKPSVKRNSETNSITREPLVLQMDTEERFGQYRSIIRQNFARQSSVVFVVPSPEEAVRAYDLLSKGISEYTFLLSSLNKKKEQTESWQKAMETKHPILFITTPLGITFDRADLNTYILERENSRVYRSMTRPFIHTKNLLLALVQITKRELILGDSLLSIESLLREKEGKYGESSPIKWRFTAAEASIVDMKIKRSEDDEVTEKPFEVLSPELQALIKKALADKTGIFLFGARKGLSPMTICGDCGAILPCPTCGAPVVLHKKGQENTYLCHKCGAKRSAETRCDVCDSWKLNPIGIGTELIAKEVKRIFPLARISVLDKDHASTRAKAKKTIQDFQELGGVLIGTEMVFTHLEKVSYVGIVSLDALFSLPDFGAEERIFYLVSRLREISEKLVIIQTRNIGKEILGWSAQGNIIDFYKREIEERETFSYPPFSLFIKVEFKGHNVLKERFAEWNPEFTRNAMIIRLKRERWPDEKLSKQLSLLPPSFLIKVDPESII